LRFLSKSQAEIAHVASETLVRHLRGILRTQTEDQIRKDRDALAQQVQAAAADDLSNMGLDIYSFDIKKVRSKG
jgi:flotillin